MLPEKVQTRLMQFIGMTGSMHDGEALNALRLAQRLMGEHKTSLVDMLKAGGSGGGFPFGDLAAAEKRGDARGHTRGSAEGYRRGWDEGVKGGYKDGYHAGYADAKQEADLDAETRERTASVPSWAVFAERCLRERRGVLNAWEQEFLTSYIERGWGSPTDKQLDVLKRIARKSGVPTP